MSGTFTWRCMPWPSSISVCLLSTASARPVSRTTHEYVLAITHCGLNTTDPTASWTERADRKPGRATARPWILTDNPSAAINTSGAVLALFRAGGIFPTRNNRYRHALTTTRSKQSHRIGLHPRRRGGSGRSVLPAAIRRVPRDLTCDVQTDNRE